MSKQQPSDQLCESIDKAVCEFSMRNGHSFTENELEDIVLSVANEVAIMLSKAPYYTKEIS